MRDMYIQKFHVERQGGRWPRPRRNQWELGDHNSDRFLSRYMSLGKRVGCFWLTYPETAGSPAL